MVLFRSLALSALVAATSAVVVSATQELDAESYAAVTSSGKNGMIKFFQPWCGHCTSMKPAWDAAAASAHESVFIADVNCSDQEKLCTEVGVQGYPTIKVYKDGAVTDYQGGRSLEDLTEYVGKELAVKCDIGNLAETCSEKATPYAAKWKVKDAAAIEKEISRLSGMAGKSMTGELKGWFQERLAILKQLSAPAAASADAAAEL